MATGQLIVPLDGPALGDKPMLGMELALGNGADRENSDERRGLFLTKYANAQEWEADACAMNIFPRSSHLRPAFALLGRVPNCPYVEMALGNHLSPEVVYPAGPPYRTVTAALVSLPPSVFETYELAA
jgi:hypothetical protein